MNGYNLLGYDWRETARNWANRQNSTPPVMITVANRTETAARVKYAFDHSKVHIPELCNRDRTLHIDSRVLSTAEAAEEPIATIWGGEDEADDDHASKLTKKQQAELLRLKVDTVGRLNREGETDTECHLRWDACLKAGTRRQ